MLTSTRIGAPPVQAASSTTPPALSTGLPGDVPAGYGSQESIASDVSASLALAPGLQSSSSNLSISTLPDSVFTSPASSVGKKQAQEVLGAHKDAAMAAAAELRTIQAFPSIIRPHTPTDVDMREENGDATRNPAATAPMILDTPSYLSQLNQAAKRTASGTVKSLTTASVPYGTIVNASPSHSRTSSATDSPNRAKIAQVSRPIPLMQCLAADLSCTALCPVEDSLVLRHDQSTEWLGEAVVGRPRNHHNVTAAEPDTTHPADTYDRLTLHFSSFNLQHSTSIWTYIFSEEAQIHTFAGSQQSHHARLGSPSKNNQLWFQRRW